MEIYVDELPMNCKDCEFSRYEDVKTFYCGILNLSLDSYNADVSRSRLCRLKETPIFQKICTIFNKDEKAVFVSDSCTDKLHYESPIGDLLEFYDWVQEDCKNFTYTDWKGARESLDKNSNISRVSCSINGTNVTLLWSDTKSYYLKDDDNDDVNLDDEYYDSKEWKIWEN